MGEVRSKLGVKWWERDEPTVGDLDRDPGTYANMQSEKASHHATRF